MHVLLLVDPEIPVPPKLYGGIERIVDWLARGLLARGQRVTLFAHPESSVPCELVAWRGRRSQSPRDTAQHVAQLARYVAKSAERPLVVHSFARVAYMTPLLPLPIAKLQSYQRAITPRSVVMGHTLSRGTLVFSACSASCARSAGIEPAEARALSSHGPRTPRTPRTPRIEVVYNGVELGKYDPVLEVAPDAPLMFLGRIERIKGPHHALELSRRTGRKLILAGNLPETGPDVDYAREIVAACDGERVRYVGPVDDAQKNALLGRAACLLMPIEWEEPFGIVMAEALACGTPVIGLRRGSVPEVVEHGTTGFVCDDVDAMERAVQQLPHLDRSAARRAASERFSSDVLCDQYLALYQSLVR